MNHIGEKSYKPSEFSVYKSAIDFSKVDVWHVFSRKLPCQIALICHDKSRTVEEISAETGTPTVYIEDELNLLIDAGVIIKPIKNKYRTNFSILKKDEVEQIKKEFLNFYKLYIPYVVSVYNKYLNEIKKSGLFKFEASNNQIAWYYALHISAFDTIDYNFTANDYPQILSCGSRAFIFAEESSGSEMAAGRTPTFLDNCTVYPCDVVAFGKIRCQLELRDKKKAQALYDIYIGHLNEEDREIYSELISQGYALKKDKKLYCNVAVSNKTNRELFNTINNELLSILKPMCFDIRKNITKIVGLSVPEHLSSYIKGFTETWIAFYSGVYLKEELLRTGFILIPDFDDNTPLACEIYEN